METKLGWSHSTVIIKEGDDNWSIFDSTEGHRYLDYRKDSVLLQYKHRGKFFGNNVLTIHSPNEDEEFYMVLLAIPYLLEIIFLKANT